MYQIIKSQNLKVYRLFIYNLIHFPLVLIGIWSLRRLLVEETVRNTPFLWAQVIFYLNK
jgi:hypothetical protein